MHAIINHAIAGLDPRDRAERDAWCIANDAHGVRMFPSYDNSDVIEFRYGGRSLALIRRDLLAGDQPLVGEFIPDVPDTVPDELNE